MRISAKLSIVIIAVNVVLITALIFIIHNRSEKLVTTKVVESTSYLASLNSEKVEQIFDHSLTVARSVAQIMEEYQIYQPAERRHIFDNYLKKILLSNSNFLCVWNCWEPNALDGMDAAYANSPGTDASGRFISAWNRAKNGEASLEALVDYDKRGEGDYYQIPLITGKEALIEPYFYMYNGEKILITSLSVPIMHDDKVIGAIGIDLDISTLQDIVESINPYENTIAAIFSNRGVIAGHFDPSRNGKNMRETEQSILGPKTNTIANMINAGERIFFQIPKALDNNDFTIIGSPFTAGHTNNPWTVMIGVPDKEVMAPVNAMLFFNILTGIGAIIIVSAAVIISAQGISRPIRKTALMLKDISEGEGDLTKRLTVKSKDEIGDMAHYFNLTLEKIHNLIVVIKEQCMGLSNVGTELASNMTETAAAVNQIAANIQSVKTQAVNQSASVSETNSTMGQITINIDKLNGHIESQSASIHQSSSAIEEMLANITSVTQTLMKNGQNVKDLASASEKGRTGLESMSSDIQKIARESDGLLEITALMNTIASQTNLLSMNAEIEAAHAGEAGRGFAVVAAEIRKLAESSAEQSKTVAAVLKQIKDSIDHILRSVAAVSSNFEVINDEIKTVYQQEESIQMAMEEQGQGSKQVLEAVEELNNISRMVKSSSGEMLQGSKEVIHESRNLEIITQEINNGMNEMAAGAEQINEAVSRVNYITGQNKENIDILIREVSRFKVDKAS